MRGNNAHRGVHRRTRPEARRNAVRTRPRTLPGRLPRYRKPLRARHFDTDAITIAQTFAGFAAVGLANAHLYETQATLAGHMQKAMESRAVIEQAKGIIMGDRRCTAEEAFAILTKLSHKLRDVATTLVTKAAETPK